MARRTMATAAVVLGMAGAVAQAQDAGKVIATRQAAGYGRHLIDGTGRSLYAFTGDRQGSGQQPGKSTCEAACATTFPPMVVDQPPAAKGRAEAELVSTTTREEGRRQATYAGWPLYYFVGDKDRGEATGQGVQQFGGTWRLVLATGEPASTAATETSLFEELKLASPECVRYDTARQRYLVSNINGKMLEADNNGFISAVALNGVAERKWIAGGRKGVTLNAPKGMEIVGDELLVADIDHLRRFDLASGEPVDSIRIEGASFLNDLTVAGDGTIYVTDTGTKHVPGAIYEVSKEREVEKVAQGRDLARPNGIDLDPEGRLVVVTFGGNKVMTMTTEGEVVETRELDSGQLDGLVVRGDGSMLVSSWKGKHIVRIDAEGGIDTIVTGLTRPACFDVDEGNGQLLVPEVKLDTVSVHPLASG